VLNDTFCALSVCVYIDGLLHKLSSLNVGCYIGNVFTGVMAYADDIAFLASTATVMGVMFHIHNFISPNWLYRNRKAKKLN